MQHQHIPHCAKLLLPQAKPWPTAWQTARDCGPGQAIPAIAYCGNGRNATRAKSAPASLEVLEVNFDASLAVQK